MTNFADKIRPRIVFDLTIHREYFYRVDTCTQPFVAALIIVKNYVECNTCNSFFVVRYQWMCKHMSGYEF
jgi:hypothetical protein